MHAIERFEAARRSLGHAALLSAEEIAEVRAEARRAMTPELLREIGRALDGPDWQTPLARRRGVNERTVRRWTAGDRAIPATLLAELVADIDARIAELRELRRRLR